MTSNPIPTSGPIASTPKALSECSASPSIQEPMFDIADEIRRLCKEGSSSTLPCLESQTESTTAPTPPSANPEFENSQSEPQDRAESEVVEGRTATLDFLSPHCVASIVESTARRVGLRAAIVVLSPSGSMIESGQYGYRASDFRTHLPALQHAARECAYGKSKIFCSEQFDAPESFDTSHELCFRPSVLLAKWAEQLDEKAMVAHAIFLPESRGHAVVVCSVPTPQARERILEVADGFSGEIASQLDTWLLVRQGKRLAGWVGAMHWIRANPRWCVIPLAMAIVALLLPVPYYPKRPCVIEPETRQYVASPIQARIASCLVQPGDVVEANQLLATIDDDQLRRDLATAQAQLESAMQKSNAALSSKTSGSYSLAVLEHEKASLEIESIEQQLQRLEIRSPVPGVVLYGDLRKSIGMPVTLGQNLFEVAELQSMTAEIHLTASDLQQVQIGSEVNVRSDATGFRGFQGTIERIEPRATVIQNEAIYIADVRISNSQDQLRPGMKATARVDAGWRSLGWLMFHRPLQWLSQQWVW